MLPARVPQQPISPHTLDTAGGGGSCPDTSGPTEPANERADALRKLTLAAERLRLVTAQHLGLSLVDSLAVSYLLADGPLGQHELAATLAMTTGSVTVLVDRLEARGFVQRTPHPHDRRRTIVDLTPYGRTRLAQASGWMTEAFQHLDPSEHDIAVRILDTVADGLTASGDTIIGRTDAHTNPSRLR